jgi:hypothetical protein
VAAVVNGPDELIASSVDTEVVGEAVAAAGLVVYEMSGHGPALEAAFLALTTDEGSRP